MSATRTSKVFALSFGKGLTSLMALVSAMVMARILSQSELATYRQTMLAYEVALPLLSLGLTHGIYYFLPTEQHRIRGVVVDGLVLMMGMGILYAVFIALGGNHLLARRFSNPAIVNTLAYLVPLPLIMLPASLLSSVMVVQNQVKKLTVYNVLTNLALSAGIITVCLIWKTPEAMVLAKVGISLLIGLIGIRLLFKSLPWDDWRPQWRSMKNMVAYSIPLVLSTALGTIALQLDKIIVSAMCGPEEFAVYSNGAIEIPLIGIMTGSIAAVIQPDLRRMVAAGDTPAALALFRLAAEKSAFVLIPVMMFLLLSAEPFILTLFSAKYVGSVLPFRLYLLILPARIVFFGSFLMALGLNTVILYRTITSILVNLVVSIVLVYWLGYIGAIIGTIVSIYIIACAWNLIVIAQSVGCKWWETIPFVNLFKVFGVAGLACISTGVLGMCYSKLPSFAILLLNILLYLSTYVFFIWYMRVDILMREGMRLWAKLNSYWKLAMSLH